LLATIQTAATARAPTITAHPLLAATGSAGGTLSSGAASIGELSMRSSAGCRCMCGAWVTSRVVGSGSPYRGAPHLGQTAASVSPVQSHRRQTRSFRTASSASHAGTDRRFSGGV
jgi:hypothetical protein